MSTTCAHKCWGFVVGQKQVKTWAWLAAEAKGRAVLRDSRQQGNGRRVKGCNSIWGGRNGGDDSKYWLWTVGVAQWAWKGAWNRVGKKEKWLRRGGLTCTNMYTFLKNVILKTYLTYVNILNIFKYLNIFLCTCTEALSGDFAGLSSCSERGTGDSGWAEEGAHRRKLQGNGYFYSFPTCNNWIIFTKFLSCKWITYHYCFIQYCSLKLPCYMRTYMHTPTTKFSVEIYH